MDIYRMITDRMIAEMERGIIPWRKPWIASGVAVSHVTGKEYSILNQLLLGEPGEYLTFRQVQAEGGRVRKGEKAHALVFWKFIEKIDEDTGEIIQVPFLRHYSVFSVEQCQNIEPKYQRKLNKSAEADEHAETIISDFVDRESITIENQEGNRAFYSPSLDEIVLPLRKQFAETAEYYSVAFHEIVHASGHMKRLGRLNSISHFGDEAYGKEELIAEIGSCALLHHCGLETPSSFQNNTSYVQNWLQVLKNDTRFIVSAAGKAEQAVAYILGKEAGEAVDETDGQAD